MSDLRRLQEIIYRLVVAPGGVTEGLAQESCLPADGLASLVLGDDRMNPIEHVEVYANGYFYRLLEVLGQDFPATSAIVGVDNFHNLVTGYIIEYPPSAPSIDHAGINFGAYLGTHPLLEHWPFLADLARLERATLDSFGAADAPALDADALRALAPAAWPVLALRAHPSTRLVECTWRVDEVLRAVADGADSSAIALPAPLGAGGAIAVWRRNTRVAYRVVEPGEAAALRLALAASGATFAVICEAIAAAADQVDDVAALINRMLARWLADGLMLALA